MGMTADGVVRVGRRALVGVLAVAVAGCHALRLSPDVYERGVAAATADPDAPVRLRTVGGTDVMLRGEWFLSGYPQRHDDVVLVGLTEPGTPYFAGGGLLIAGGLVAAGFAIPVAMRGAGDAVTRDLSGKDEGDAGQYQLTAGLLGAGGVAALVAGIVLVVLGHQANREALVPPGGFDPSR